MMVRRFVLACVCAVLVSSLVPGVAFAGGFSQAVDAGNAELTIRRGATGLVTDPEIEPAASVRLGMLADFDFMSIYTYVMCGFLYNPGSVAVENPTISLRYYNASGGVIRTDTWHSAGGDRSSMFYVLEPGDIAPFRIQPSEYGGPPPGTVAWELTASSSTCPKYSIWPSVNNTVAEASNNNTAHFAGTVTNDTPYVLDELIVSAVVVHRTTGVIYDIAWVRTPGPIAVGETVGYDIWAEDRPVAADMEFILASEGKKATSTTPVTRIFGRDRFETGLEASKRGFADGSAPKVVVASGLQFADALSAAPLAGAYDAPILLVKPGSVPWPIDFKAELERLGCTEVIIVGGESAVSAVTADQLKTMLPEGAVVRRLAGSDRYSTCAAVLRELKVATAATPPTEAFVVRGDVFPDALASAPYAWSRHMPVVLVRPTAVSSGVAAALGGFAPSKLWVIGSTTAVADKTAKVFGVPWQRVAGPNRYSTATAMMLTAVDEGWTDAGTMGIASGVGFPDALVAGPVLGASNGALLLSGRTTLAPPTASGLYTVSEAVNGVQFYGGEPALSAWVLDQARYLCQ